MARRSARLPLFSAHLIWGMGVIAASGAAARAQVDDPALDDASVDEVQEQMRARPRASEPVPAVARPEVRPASGLPADRELARWLSDRGIGVPMGRVLPAGTFLSRRSGIVLRAPTGERIIAFALDASGEADLAPMVLLPSSTLMRMDAITLEGEGTLAVVVSGEVTVYRGRNYLLPTAFAPMTLPNASDASELTTPPEEPAPGAAQADDPGASAAETMDSGDEGPADAEQASAPEPIDAGALAGDPRVRELMEELALRRGGARGVSDRSPADGTGANAREGPTSREPGNAQVRGLIAEGEFLSRRRARLVRLGGGGLAVAFDSSAMLPARGDAALTLLPCDVLERLERLAERTERELVLEFSGRVYTYDGANYLLPVLAMMLPPEDLRGMP